MFGGRKFMQLLFFNGCIVSSSFSIMKSKKKPKMWRKPLQAMLFPKKLNWTDLAKDLKRPVMSPLQDIWHVNVMRHENLCLKTCNNKHYLITTQNLLNVIEINSQSEVGQ